MLDSVLRSLRAAPPLYGTITTTLPQRIDVASCLGAKFSRRSRVLRVKLPLAASAREAGQEEATAED